MNVLKMLEAQRAEKLVARAALIGELETLATAAISESRALNTEESTSVDVTRSSLSAIDAELDELEPRIAELVAIRDRVIPVPQIVKPVTKPDANTDIRSLDRSEARSMALAAVEGADLSTDQQVGFERMLNMRGHQQNGHLVALRTIATENDEYRSAWQKMVTEPHPVLSGEESAAVLRFREVERAMSIGTDGAGGFGIPVVIDPTIMSTKLNSDPITEIANVKNILNDELKMVSTTGVSWSFDAEASAVSDDSPTLAQPVITTAMARGFIPFSIEVGMDYPEFEAQMSALLAEGYTDLRHDKLVRGTGSGEPTGIMTAISANASCRVLPATDGGLAVGDLDATWAALPQRFRTNATWLWSTDVDNRVRNFGATYGSSFTRQLNTADGGSNPHDRPVAVSDYMPSFTGTTGSANIMIVGDFSRFVVAQRVGMSIELVPMLFDVTNNRPTGSRGWFAYARLGSNSVSDLAFRILQNA